MAEIKQLPDSTLVLDAKINDDDRKILRQLAPHERDLLLSGALKNETHAGASSVRLDAPSFVLEKDTDKTLVYRPMGDTELLYLLDNKQLPSTQPYQAIIEGESGRTYAEKYLFGAKWVDTSPTSVVEFLSPSTLIRDLFKRQHKAEDGALSHGLGSKAGNTLPLFNESLKSGQTTFRIVKVKRPIAGKRGKSGHRKKKDAPLATSATQKAKN